MSLSSAFITSAAYDERGRFKDVLTSESQQKKFLRDQLREQQTTDAEAPPGLLIVRDYLDPAICTRIVEYAEAETGTPSLVGDPDRAETALLAARSSAVRITENIEAGVVEPLINNAVREAYFHEIATHFHSDIEWIEQPQLLRYRAGGHYELHADSDQWHAPERCWVRLLDRDLSLLIYLNDTFAGGELEFPNFDYRIAPEAGMLVAFPSDHRYMHAATETTEGVRYVIVSWAAARGSIRVKPAPDAGVIRG